MSRLLEALRSVELRVPKYSFLVSLPFLLLAFVFGFLLASCRMAAVAPAITAVSKAEWKQGGQAEGPSHPMPMPLFFSEGRITPSIHQQMSSIMSIGQNWPRLPTSQAERNRLGPD